MPPTLYEFAGGAQAFLALAAAHHARCLQDPELNHPFSHPGQHPQHVERLAAYWGEVLGGPQTYSGECSGSHAAAVGMHCGNGDISDLNRRFLVCFTQAMDDAGLPDDVAFRTAMNDFMTWAISEFTARADDGESLAADSPMPRWSWAGLQPSRS